MTLNEALNEQMKDESFKKKNMTLLDQNMTLFPHL